METIASALEAAAVRIIRFEFPCMAERRRAGVRRPPDREAVLRQSWLDVIAELGVGRHLVIGGKPMGGRIASMVADEAHVRGLVCLGYPFHPRVGPTRLRTAHLRSLQTPALFVQGERDAFGSRGEVDRLSLPATIRIEWLADGDHSFKPRRSSGSSLARNLDAAVAAVVAFVSDLSSVRSGQLRTPSDYRTICTTNSRSTLRTGTLGQ
jgi:predicted alpha/beta-hydrolase family hydrolase